MTSKLCDKPHFRGYYNCKKEFNYLNTFFFVHIFDFCCDCCLKNTNRLVVLINIFLEIPLQIKILISPVIALSARLESFNPDRESLDVWGWFRLAGTIVHLGLSLCVVPVMPQTSSTLP